jgi:D-tyrosyl-tRNA(Tyr) deacylase
MRAVVQRVKRASVEVEGRVTGSIGHGLLVFLGIEEPDTAEVVKYICDKVANLRIFEDEEGKMNRSVLDAGGAVLLVSQFTLYGDARHGRRPSFSKAARPETAIPLYEQAVAALREILPLETGEFQAMMEVSLINDGPVTILLDSKRMF